VIIDLLRFAVIGGAAGGLYAVLALGLVVVFRSSRVVNFGHAAIGVSSAYVFDDLRGDLPTAAAVAVAVAFGVALGLLIDVALIRPLRAASPLTRAIGAIGVLVTLQAVLNLRYGDDPRIVQPLLPTRPVDLGGLSVGADRLIVLGISAVLAAVLYAVYRRSRFGLATSALSENQRSLAALGWSPARIGMINWAISGGLAAVAGILIAPITGLTPTVALTLLMPALAAALLGGLASFPLTLLGGLAVGVAQAEVSRFAHVQGLQDAVPFIGIMIVLAFQGASLPTRGHLAEKLPVVGSGRVPWPLLAVATGAGVYLAQWGLDEAWVAALTTTLIVAIVLLSVVVVTGYTGQLSLAAFAMAGVGALVAARLVSDLGWPFLAALAVASVAAGLVGLLVGLPAVRTRGTSLAIVTLGLAVAVQSMVLDNARLSKGINGIPVDPPTILGIHFDALFQPRRYALLALAVLVLTGIGVLNLRRSGMGRRMVAVRANERAAASLGIGVPGVKLYAFVLSGMIASVGGVLLAFTNSIVVVSNPGSAYNPFNSLNATAQATVGGVGFAGGAVAGTMAQVGGLGDKVLDLFGHGDWLAVAGGLLLIVTVVTAPDGVAAQARRAFAPVSGRLRPRRRDRARPPRPAEAAVERVAPARLVVTDLTVAFGGFHVLDKVSLELTAGSVLGVLGPNGAGKSTLVDAITGYTRPRSGSATLDGRELVGLTPAARGRLGVTRSFQSLELFEDLSVVDNLLVAAERPSWPRACAAMVAPGRPRLSPAAMTAAAELGLDRCLEESPAALSYGDRRLLAIARALAARPRVLLLDEPAAGLGEQERQELRRLIRTIADQWGVAVLLIEHDVELVLDVADRVLALDFGRTIAAGPPESIRRHPAVVEAYLGAAHAGTDAPSDRPERRDAREQLQQEQSQQEEPALGRPDADEAGENHQQPWDGRVTT
jgi:sulfate-transporting ATPase